MHYILFYQLVDDYLEKRGEYRKEHLANASTLLEKGELVMAGAFANPADGAVFIFKSEDSCVANTFAKNDPYVKNGLIKSWEVREWTVAIGN